MIEYLRKEFGFAVNQNRIPWVDAIKGIAMILIMWGHVQSTSPLKLWLTSFHVPLYLILSGILICHSCKSSGKRPSGDAKKLTNKLLRPYLSFSVIAVICLFCYSFFCDGFESGAKSIVLNVYKTITCYGILAIWFIPSYGIACYIFGKTWHNSFWISVLTLILWAGIGIAGSSFFSYLHETASLLKYNIVYYPVSALLRGIACTYYIVLGKILYELYLKFHKYNGFAILLGIVCVACLLSSIYLSQFLTDTNFSTLQFGEKPYLIFVCGTLGSIWVIVFFYFLRKVCAFPLLQFIGRKSLIIMGTHMSLLLTVLIPALLSLIISIPPVQTIGYYLFGLGCVVIMIILEIPIIYIFDGKMSFLIRKTQK